MTLIHQMSQTSYCLNISASFCVSYAQLKLYCIPIKVVIISIKTTRHCPAKVLNSMWLCYRYYKTFKNFKETSNELRREKTRFLHM